MVALLEVNANSMFASNTLILPSKECRPVLKRNISDEVVMPAYDYIANLPSTKGKDKTMAALNVWFAVPEEKMERIMKITNLLHNASLMIDDIQDGSELRRGQPAAHIRAWQPLLSHNALAIQMWALCATFVLQKRTLTTKIMLDIGV